MKIAIIGGGISGLAAAYELELARLRGADIDWQLYESTNRLGGIIQTARRDGFILEGGPDGWVTEKSWASDFAIELGLEDQLIYSNDATRKTYILFDNQLQPMPDRMRMMVPEDLATLEGSPLFSDAARKAYADELLRADELKASAPAEDESVASFVLRHFGEEVLKKIADPLLSGVFGGDVHKLSVRAVMPQFVAMEREYGSLIAALQAKASARGERAAQPIFTSLRDGVGSLVEALVARLPPERVLLNRSALSLKRERGLWCLRTSKGEAGKSKKHFHHIFIAAPLDTTRALLQPLDPQALSLMPQQTSSTTLASFCWPAKAIKLPQGFGFLVPQTHVQTEPQLLACTFVDQKFPHRAPIGAHILRVFFGSNSAEHFANTSDEAIATVAFAQLRTILGPLPTPDQTLTAIRRWPRSLPQYEVGHLDRIAELDTHIAALGGLSLLGNAYRGVGLPDLLHHARIAARALIAGA